MLPCTTPEHIGFMFSADVKELFFSVPHAELLESVRYCIEENGEDLFPYSTGMNVHNFINLREFYLNSTFLTFDNSFYLQRRGICIGSCVAPVRCNIFLSYIDRTLGDVFNGNKVVKVFRYVDDFIILLKKQNQLSYDDLMNGILDDFRQQGKGLTFAHEVPKEESRQLLDIEMSVSETHVLDVSFKNCK